MIVTCLVPYLSLTSPLPMPYLSLTHLTSLGLSRSHKGMGTDSIFDFSHPPVQPPVNFLKLYNTYYVNMSCPLFPSLTLILSLNLPCPLSLTPPLSLLYHFLTHPYPSLTFTLWSLTSYKFQIWFGNNWEKTSVVWIIISLFIFFLYLPLLIFYHMNPPPFQFL